MSALKYAVLPALGLALLAPCLPAQHAVKKTAAASSAAPAGMTNDDVIALAGAGMSDQIIVAKIKAAPSTSFDTSVAGLKSLKAANVSSNVIAVMIDPTAAVAAAAAPTMTAAAAPNSTAPANPDDPMAAHAPGIYILAKGTDGQEHMTLLERTSPKQQKSGGAWVSGMTYGLAKAHSKAVLDGAKASVETPDTKPVFYLYIPQGSDAGFGGSGYNPKEFAMIKFEVKSDTRLVTTGSYSIWGGSSGTDEKARQGFSSDTVKPGVYKLTPVEDLPPGEYAFQQGAAFYYDFGVQPST